MSVHALITGTIFRSAESRTSKAGRPFVAATVRCQDSGALQSVRIVAFSQTVQDELLRLADGDAVSAQGPLKVETYTAGDGSTKVSLSLVADRVMLLRQPAKRKPSSPEPAAAPDTRSRQERLAGSWQSPADGPNDDLPF